MIRLVPETPPKVTKEDYREIGNRTWPDIKGHHVAAQRSMSTLAGLLHQKPTKWHHVKGARHEALELRDTVDAIVVALTEIIESGERAARSTGGGDKS